MLLLSPWMFFLTLFQQMNSESSLIHLSYYLLCEMCPINPSLWISCIYFSHWSHSVCIHLASTQVRWWFPWGRNLIHDTRHRAHTYVNIFFPSFPQPTRQIHVVPKGQDTPSKTLLYSSGYDRPCDYNRHPSQLWHGIWDIPMKRNYKVGVNATLGCITTTEEKPVLDLVYF